ncbi:MAG: dihydropteroate synthase, partial [Planctomycetota bacterium]
LDAARRRAEEMVSEGASWIDIGGESTRPGSSPVAEKEELERVLPITEALIESGLPAKISIDSQKGLVAQETLALGVHMINDVSGGRQDPGLLEAVAAAQSSSKPDSEGPLVCLMHMQGTPQTMQQDPRYDDPVAEIKSELQERLSAGLKAGIPLSKIVLDPGIGFGKRLADNLVLLRRLDEFRELGRPLLLGVSRKGFIGALGGHDRPTDRVGGTAAAVALCVERGAAILRVHDVAAMDEAVRVAVAISRPDLPVPGPPSPRSRPFAP